MTFCPRIVGSSRFARAFLRINNGEFRLEISSTDNLDNKKYILLVMAIIVKCYVCSEIVNMEDQYLSCTKEVRAVIRFLNFQNVFPTEIHRKITEVYGPNVMSRKSVSVWCSKFNLGRESVEDEARSGRPISTSTTETIQAVEKLLRSDRRLKIREMAIKLDLPKTTVHEIVHGKLNFHKVCARWVPKMLTAGHKNTRMRISQAHLNRACNDENFVEHLITGDETWVHYSTPCNKRDSMTWKHYESPVPKKFKRTISSKKVMATVFLGCAGNFTN
ncbi:hypothetical protein QTP88_003757 [Uroleucon formosanum]